MVKSNCYSPLRYAPWLALRDRTGWLRDGGAEPPAAASPLVPRGVPGCELGSAEGAAWTTYGSRVDSVKKCLILLYHLRQ